MAAFIFSNWQGTKTRIPGIGKMLDESETQKVVYEILPILPLKVREDVINFLRHPEDGLSESSRVVLESTVKGYIAARKR